LWRDTYHHRDEAFIDAFGAVLAARLFSTPRKGAADIFRLSGGNGPTAGDRGNVHMPVGDVKIVGAVALPPGTFCALHDLLRLLIAAAHALDAGARARPPGAFSVADCLLGSASLRHLLLPVRAILSDRQIETLDWLAVSFRTETPPSAAAAGAVSTEHSYQAELEDDDSKHWDVEDVREVVAHVVKCERADLLRWLFCHYPRAGTYIRPAALLRVFHSSQPTRRLLSTLLQSRSMRASLNRAGALFWAAMDRHDHALVRILWEMMRRDHLSAFPFPQPGLPMPADAKFYRAEFVRTMVDDDDSDTPLAKLCYLRFAVTHRLAEFFIQQGVDPLRRNRRGEHFYDLVRRLRPRDLLHYLDSV
jgi:hypothetical protein